MRRNIPSAVAFDRSVLRDVAGWVGMNISEEGASAGEGWGLEDFGVLLLALGLCFVSSKGLDNLVGLRFCEKLEKADRKEFDPNMW